MHQRGGSTALWNRRCLGDCLRPVHPTADDPAPCVGDVNGLFVEPRQSRTGLGLALSLCSPNFARSLTHCELRLSCPHRAEHEPRYRQARDVALFNDLPRQSIRREPLLPALTPIGRYPPAGRGTPSRTPAATLARPIPFPERRAASRRELRALLGRVTTPIERAIREADPPIRPVARGLRMSSFASALPRGPRCAGRGRRTRPVSSHSVCQP